MRGRSAGVVAAALGVVAGTVLVTGCGHAKASAATPSAGTSGSSARGRGAVDFTSYSDNDGPKSAVILTGAIGDYGDAVTVGPDGSVDPEHGGDLRLSLTRGSFGIRIAELDRRMVAEFTDFPPNRTTCSGNVTVSGAAPVVAGSGTGSYRGITGSFQLTVTIAEVDARTHCTPSSAFLKQEVVTAGPGTVSLR